MFGSLLLRMGLRKCTYKSYFMDGILLELVYEYIVVCIYVGCHLPSPFCFLSKGVF
jgi:hypothetical protein